MKEKRHVAQIRFCMKCGFPLEMRPHDGIDRLCCTRYPECDFVYFERLIVGAGAYIEDNGQLLLIRRTHEPCLGCWALPGGHVEAYESPLQAATREVKEETGLSIEPVEPASVFYTNDLPGPHRIFFVYGAKVTGGTLRVTSEADAPTYFPPNSIPDNLSTGGHKDAIVAWRDERL